MPEPTVRLTLDQNFPVPVHRIDPRVSELDDRRLLIALRQLGWHGLITNNYKMLWVPAEIAAVVDTRLVAFIVEGVGDDPLRATGALLLDLPPVVRRIRPGKAHVFRVHPRVPQPEDAWKYFQQAAARRNLSPNVLYDEVKVTDDELTAPVP